MLKSTSRGYLVRLRGAGDRDLGDNDLQRANSALAGLGSLARAGVDREHFRLELAAVAVLGDTLAALASSGAVVLDCAQQRSELEESFLRLTTART